MVKNETYWSETALERIRAATRMMGAVDGAERIAMSLRCHSDITLHSQQHNLAVCCYPFFSWNKFLFSLPFFCRHGKRGKEPVTKKIKSTRRVMLSNIVIIMLDFISPFLCSLFSSLFPSHPLWWKWILFKRRKKSSKYGNNKRNVRDLDLTFSFFIS